MACVGGIWVSLSGMKIPYLPAERVWGRECCLTCLIPPAVSMPRVLSASLSRCMVAGCESAHARTLVYVQLYSFSFSFSFCPDASFCLVWPFADHPFCPSSFFRRLDSYWTGLDWIVPCTTNQYSSIHRRTTLLSSKQHHTTPPSYHLHTPKKNERNH
jgi:hypothetical protein